MYALFLILNDIYLLDEVHEIFYENQVGATTMDSSGLGKTLFEHNIDMIVFSSIKKIIEGDRPYNKTIVSVIRDEEKLNKVVSDIDEFLCGIKAKGLGFMFIVPVLEIHGFKGDDNSAKEHKKSIYT